MKVTINMYASVLQVWSLISLISLGVAVAVPTDRSVQALEGTGTTTGLTSLGGNAKYFWASGDGQRTGPLASPSVTLSFPKQN